MSADPVLRFEAHALGRPFHAGRVTRSPRLGESGPHTHADFYEFMGIVAGTGEQRLRSGAQRLCAGDVVLVRPRDHHRILGAAPDGMTFVNVAFPADAWRGFVDLTRIDPANDWDRGTEPPRFTMAGNDVDAMCAVFDDALKAFQANPTTLDLMRFWTAVTELIATVRDGDPTDAPARPAWLTCACAEMRREENLRGGVPRLQDLAGVSAAHLSRTMRAEYGVTPTGFVGDLRLERAATLLATTDATVTEIAYRCGYSSQSYFTRCFRDAHGSSPRDFRRQARTAFVP